MKRNKTETNKPEKEWHEKLQVIVPIIVALIGVAGILLSKSFPGEAEIKPAKETKRYELVFIDQKTLRPAEFQGDARVKVFAESPPLILPITLSSAQFLSDRINPGETTFLEFDNYPGYRLIDRKQLLHEGRNEIFVAGASSDQPLIKRTAKAKPVKAVGLQAKTRSTISGRIIDQQRKAVQGVLVVISDESMVSDTLGRFTVSFPATNSRVRLRASKAGYKDWDDYVAANKTNLVIEMKYPH